MNSTIALAHESKLSVKLCFIEPANLGGMPSTTTDDTDEDRPKIMKESRQQEWERKSKERAEEKNKKL